MFPDFFRFLLYRSPRKCGKMRKKSKSFLEPAIFMNSSKICVYSFIFDFFMIFAKIFFNFSWFFAVFHDFGSRALWKSIICRLWNKKSHSKRQLGLGITEIFMKSSKSAGKIVFCVLFKKLKKLKKLFF